MTIITSTILIWTVEMVMIRFIVLINYHNNNNIDNYEDGDDNNQY